MRSKNAQPQKHSLRTLVIFCSVVFLIIFISLGVRLFYLVQNSQFDGEHRFTIAFNYQNKELDLVSLNPEDRSLSHLKVRGGKDFQEAKNTVGVFTDTTFVLDKPFNEEKNLTSYMTSAIFHNGVKSDLSSYDLIRLALAARGQSAKTGATEEIKLPLEKILIDQISQELFLDNTLLEENQTIEVVNGAGTVGLGGRLERAITIMGANVIAVSNSDDPQATSQIIYFGEETYTLERLEKLLDIKSVKKEERGLSDIIILIGEDKAETISY